MKAIIHVYKELKYLLLQYSLNKFASGNIAKFLELDKTIMTVNFVWSFYVSKFPIFI